LVWAGLLLAATPARGQGPAPEPGAPTDPDPGAEGSPAAPGVVPLDEVARRSEETAGRLLEIEDLLSPVEEIEAITQQLPDQEAMLQAALTSFRAEDLSELSRSYIQSTKGNIEDFDQMFARDASEVDERVKSLGALRAELSDLSELWARTQRVWGADRSVVELLPPTIVERVAQLADRIEGVEARLKARLEPLLVVQNRISENRVRIGEALTRLEEATEQARTRVFRQDSDPFWVLLTRERTISAETSETVSAVARAFTVDFWPRYRDRVLIHVLLVFALAVFLLRMSRLEPKGLEAETEAKILRRPFSSAFVLSLLAYSFLYPKAPPEVSSIIALLTLIPVSRLVLALLPPPFHGIVWGLGLVYVLDRSEYLIAGSVVSRSLRLALDLVLVGCASWFTWSPRLRVQYGENRLYRAIRVVAILLVGVATVSFILNFIVFSRLAELITRGSVSSVYAGVVLAAASSTVGLIVFLLLHSPFGQRSRAVRLHAPSILAQVRGWVKLLAWGYWGFLVLRYFDVRDGLFESVGRLLSEPLVLGSASVRLGDVLAVFVVLFVSVQISRLIRFVLDEEVLPQLPLARGVPTAISRGTSYVLLTAGFLLAMSAAGIQLSQLTVMVGALGVGVGFGLQNLVNNFVSGLILVFERPIQVGDWVDFGTQSGRVTSIGIRASVVRTWSGAEVIVPNGDLVSVPIINWTLSDRRRRIEIQVRIGSEADPERAIEIMKGAAQAHDKVVEEPPPNVIFKSYQEGAMELELWAWVGDVDVRLSTRTQLAVAIQNGFKAAGMAIAMPGRDIRQSTSAPRPELERPRAESEGDEVLPADRGADGDAASADEARPQPSSIAK
jgi:small-conductance mechanosensitive channel